AVSLRRHSSLTLERLTLLTEALVLFQRATSAYLLLIPFQTAQDLEITKAIAAQLRGDYQIVEREDPRQLKGLFREINLTIGMRLHSLIMAASEGSRCFALSYDPKVTRLMTELDLAGYELTDLPTSAEEISQAWQDCLTQSQPFSQEKRESLKEQTQVHRALLERFQVR
ncbi:MAG: polysaccharide pyruvyl transferase family protein, partial [Microcystaceae cyanobacterium]